MQNKHINEFLDYYIKLENPQYAVLLKGKWGSGKTHFINEYKKQLDTNNQKYIYVSLYGVTKYDEIEIKFLEAIYPRLYNKKTIFAGKIAKQLLKGTFKIDLDNDGNDDGNASFQIPNFKQEDLLNTKDYILIFDDLERCSINIINLLGYINFFVEHQSYKVILIANEEELEKTDKYTQIKEKLIGKTFEFKTNSIFAYDSFLSELKNTNKIKENILENEKLNILELFNKSKSNNLRALRQSLLDFERFYDEVLIIHLKKEELIKDVLYWFFLFSFEMRQGNNEIFKLDEIRGEHILSLSNSNDNKEKTKFEIYNDKYSFGHFEQILSFKNWEKILLNSNIEKEEIDSALKNSKYYISEKFYDWKLLYSYFNLNDETFEKIVNDIYFKISNTEYTVFEEVKMVASILLNLKEKNLIEKDIFCLEYEIKKQIDFLFYNDMISDEIILGKNLHLYDSFLYKSYEYMKSESFNEILEYIDEKTVNKLEEKLKKDSLLIIDAIVRSDIYSLYIDGNFPYYNKPIFKYIDTEILFEKLINSDNKTIREFFNILNDRYKSDIDRLISEKDFLEKLQLKVEEYIKSKTGKLSVYHFSNFLNNLEKNIKRLNNQVNLYEKIL
ncbi:MAG: KAP family NTPase [Campylobacterales bacterium]|nr:KAP family NTPase [Campylobacterales bacterium]